MSEKEILFMIDNMKDIITKIPMEYLKAQYLLNGLDLLKDKLEEK